LLPLGDIGQGDVEDLAVELRVDQDAVRHCTPVGDLGAEHLVQVQALHDGGRHDVLKLHHQLGVGAFAHALGADLGAQWFVLDDPAELAVGAQLHDMQLVLGRLRL
jgi:hypothetical protein